MKREPNTDKIANGLGAERRGKVEARAGHFGALQLLMDLEERLRGSASAPRPHDLISASRRKPTSRSGAGR
jgi:hypothetical protein